MRHHLQITSRTIFVLIVLCLSMSGLVFGQEVTGSIVGTVKDTNGAAVPGATVTITDAQKKVVVRTITANDDGEFSAPNLQPGLYDIGAEAANFKKSVLNSVKLDVGQRGQSTSPGSRKHF